MTLEEALTQAVSHHRSGRMQEAEQLYFAVLQAQPKHPDANHNLGVLAVQAGRVSAALVYFKTALESNPSQGQYWLSFIDALLQAGRRDVALQVLEQGRRGGLAGPAVDALVQRLQPAVGPASSSQPSIGDMQAVALTFSQGQLAQALAAAQTLTERFPEHGFGWKVLGAVYKQMGRNQQALQPMIRAAQLALNDAEAHANLGATQLDLGLLQDAEASYCRVLQLSPAHAVARCNLGTILRRTARLSEAEQSYRAALELDPAFADAHYNLGNTLRELGRLAEAELSYRNALRMRPEEADAWSNLGALLRQMARGQEAADSYRRAADLKPEQAESHNNLGVALQDLQLFDQAQACFRRALALKPDFAEAHNNLGAVLQNVDQMDEAKECYRKAYELGFYGARIKAALLLPPVMGTQEQVLRSRAEFEQGLDWLIADNRPVPDVIVAGCGTNFYLAYHGLDDRPLQTKVARYYEQACPSLLYQSPHCEAAKSTPGEVKRIGFFSKYMTRHSVSLCFSKIIEAMAARPCFDVIVISTHPIDAQIQAACGGTALQVPADLPLARQQIADLQLDALVYLDVGMDPFGFFLAFARLAPMQCVLGGHPVTTGISNLDYFISSDLMEPTNAQEHYSEKLVRLPTPLFYFERPKVPSQLKSRAALGLHVDRHLYMCPMRLQKLHPEFDEAIIGVLTADPDGEVVLFDDLYLPQGKAMLQERLEQTVPVELRERITFVPWMKDPVDFMSAVACAEVILDPFHFGIGSTTALTCVVGTPVVTRTGEFMRGRVGTAFCEMLDLAECIAVSTDDYVRKAVQIATDSALRERLRTRMMRNDAVFYGNTKPIDDFIEFVDQATGGRVPPVA